MSARNIKQFGFCKATALVIILSISGCGFLADIQAPNNIAELSYAESTSFADVEELEEYRQRVKRVTDYLDEVTRRNRKSCSPDGLCLEEIVVTAQKSSSANPVITNNQEVGVDEGDIVKVIGNYFVILRKGRLYSVSYASDSSGRLSIVDQVNVFKPDWPHDAWYDELLVSNSTILVTGYLYHSNFESAVSELNILSLDENGFFSHHNTYLIKSSDYYSSENYASRIIDGNLYLYIPQALFGFGEGERNDDEFYLPSLGRVIGGKSKQVDWQPLLSVNQIVKPVQPLIDPVLHTVVRCPLNTRLDSCSARSFVGGNEHKHYVTTDSVYIWNRSLSEEGIWALRDESYSWYWPGDDPAYFKAMIHRIDFNELGVAAVEVEGEPQNQFSFTKTDDGLVALLYPLDDESQPRLFDISLSDFSLSGEPVEPMDIQLPILDDGGNVRFIGDSLVIGEYSGWEKNRGRPYELYVQPLEELQNINITLEHGVDRIESVGDKAFLMGYSANNTLMSSILDVGDNPQVISSIKLPGVDATESRSHAFNSHIRDDGVKVVGFAASAYEKGKNVNDYDDVSDLYFLIMDETDSLHPLGSILSRQMAKETDDCEYSCTDWYGNTRAFFIHDRVFGLAGDEMIEAVVGGVSVYETQRVNITR